jgi:uncharacterized phage protein (TIGR01671 family)
MTREIKFRRINKLTGQADYVSLNNDFHYAQGWLENSVLSHATGLRDKNDIEIYESDVVRFYWKGSVVDCLVVWDIHKAMFCLKWKDGYVNGHHLNAERYEVVGNIIQNPSLF